MMLLNIPKIFDTSSCVIKTFKRPVLRCPRPRFRLMLFLSVFATEYTNYPVDGKDKLEGRMNPIKCTLIECKQNYKYK